MTNIKVPETAELHARLMLQDVLRLTRLSRSKTYLLIKHGKFSAPIKLGRASRWVAHKIRQPLAAEVAAR